MMKTTPIPHNTFREQEVVVAEPPIESTALLLQRLETALDELAPAGAGVMRTLASESAKEDKSHERRAGLIHLEIAISDLLFQLKTRTPLH
jgi:hypothetical protein